MNSMAIIYDCCSSSILPWSWEVTRRLAPKQYCVSFIGPICCHHIANSNVVVFGIIVANRFFSLYIICLMWCIVFAIYAHYDPISNKLMHLDSQFHLSPK